MNHQCQYCAAALLPSHERCPVCKVPRPAHRVLGAWDGAGACAPRDEDADLQRVLDESRRTHEAETRRAREAALMHQAASSARPSVPQSGFMRRGVEAAGPLVHHMANAGGGAGVRNSEEDELRLAKALSQREYEEEQERRRAPHQEGLGLGSGADVHGAPRNRPRVLPERGRAEGGPLQGAVGVDLGSLEVVAELRERPGRVWRFEVEMGVAVELEEDPSATRALLTARDQSTTPEQQREVAMVGAHALVERATRLFDGKPYSSVKGHIFVDQSNVLRPAQVTGTDATGRPTFDNRKRVHIGNLASLLEAEVVPQERHVSGSTVSEAGESVMRRWADAGYRTSIERKAQRADKEDAVDVKLRDALSLCAQRKFGRERHTIILVTGDGNYNNSEGVPDYESNGFPTTVELALTNGFDVEIWAWRRSMAGVYARMQRAYPARLKLVYLDDFREHITFTEREKKPHHHQHHHQHQGAAAGGGRGHAAVGGRGRGRGRGHAAGGRGGIPPRVSSQAGGAHPQLPTQAQGPRRGSTQEHPQQQQQQQQHRAWGGRAAGC